MAGSVSGYPHSWQMSSQRPDPIKCLGHLCFLEDSLLHLQGLQIWLRKIIRFWERWIFIKCFFYIHRNFPYAGRFLKITDQGSFLLLFFNLSSMCWGARNWQISPKMDKFDQKIKKIAKFSQWKPMIWHRINQYYK